MDFGLMITIFLIGFIGSYISGMLGIGGSIIKYPMLLYIPGNLLCPVPVLYSTILAK